MIWLLAALMQLSTVVVESIQPTADSVEVTLRNNSEKTVTAFVVRQRESVSRIVDFADTGGISPQAVYLMRIPTGGLPDQIDDVRLLAVVFADGTSEGEPAKGILARREGALQARLRTARQVRAFLQFNTVFDDSAMSVLDRELEQEAQLPDKLTTNHEKHSWEAGYSNVLQEIRRNLMQAPQNHRREQLEKIGGAR